MLPLFSEQDTADGRKMNAKPSCQFRLTNLIAQDADLANLVFGEFGGSQAHNMGVARVPGRSSPFQVHESVVGLDAVDVITLLARGRRSVEGSEYQTMKFAGCGLPATPKVNEEITPGVQGWCENSPRPSTAPPPNAAYSALIGDLVQSFVPNNGKPSFLDQGKLCRLRVHRNDLFRCHVAGRHPPSRPQLLSPISDSSARGPA